MSSLIVRTAVRLAGFTAILAAILFGCAGSLAFILMFSAPPLVLGSLTAFALVGPAMGLMVVRTVLEDVTLGRELGGYQDYTARVRYRLLPGIW